MKTNSVNGSIPKIPPVPSNPAEARKTENGNSLSFGEYLMKALENVNDLQLEADRSAQEFAAGMTDNIHKVMIDSEKAELALQFTLQVRGKILDAYNEIMRMQI